MTERKAIILLNDGFVIRMDYSVIGNKPRLVKPHRRSRKIHPEILVNLVKAGKVVRWFKEGNITAFVLETDARRYQIGREIEL